MKVNIELRGQIFEIIHNQIKMNNPPETGITYNRLIAMGYSEMEVKQLIGQCVALELFSVLKEKQPFNESRYVKNLRQLPKEPFE
jgi:hypothetical protein